MKGIKLPAIVRPNGKIYRPRTIQPIGLGYDEITDILVLGTHDVRYAEIIAAPELERLSNEFEYEDFRLEISGPGKQGLEDQGTCRLAQHEDCAFSASGVVVCSCGAALQPNEVMWDMSNLAAHQAEVLAANGYGKLEDAFEQGRKSGMRHADRVTAALKIGRPELAGPPSPNPYRRPE